MKFSNKDFVHFHSHSSMSKFDCLCSPYELAMQARKMGFLSQSITDHGNIQGWISFIKACRSIKDKKGKDIPYAPIKPILGCEFYLARKMDIGQYDEKLKKKGEPVRQQPDKRKGNRHINLYALNWNGYKNICRLSQVSFTRGFYSDPRIDITTLAEHSEGIMIGSACLSSLINVNLMYGRYDEAKQVCTTLKDIFGENFFLEIMYHGIPEEREILPYIFQLSRELEIPVVATNDSHYIYKEQGKSQELLMCMSQQKCIKDPKRLKFKHMEFYLKSADEMYKLFKGHPEALINSKILAERIDTKDIEDNIFGGMRLPIFDIPSEYKGPFEYMEKLAWEGMKRVGWDKSQPHIDALKMELNDVLAARDNNDYDFSTYFLIVKDYIENAKKDGALVGPGRGSGFASVLLRSLGITYGVDPLEHGLLWSRFLAFSTNKDGKRVFARAGFPDIDTDFDDEKRDSVYEYMILKYGRENVGNIGTHGLLKFKSCVTRIVKALDIAGSFRKSPEAYISDNVQKVTEILEPFPKKGYLKTTDENGNEHLIKDFPDAYRYCSEFTESIDKHPEIKTHAEHIEGTFANFSSHASGICISDVPLDEIAPLRMARKGILATQFPSEDLESLGLIKFDILAIATLTVIKNTIKMIKKNYNITIDLENLALNDQDTFEMYRTGNLGGVFQCENWGMQRTMRDMKVDSFGDIMAGIALYRPGPMDSIPKYCARKDGEEEVSYFHPSIEPFVKKHLEDTYGLAVYQEQVMQICNSLAGFDISDGYVMIKAIGKKKEYLMNKFKEQFISGCVKNGVDEYIATEYWTKFIIPFASYGFNRAHSACYGFNSYLTAYLKAHYPEEFMCSFLNVITHGSGDKYDKIEAFEREFKRKMNVKFLPRDINRSKVKYIIEKSGDRCGGTKIEMRPSLICKGVGFKAAENIEQNQPFKDLEDFVERINTSTVDTRVVEALAIGGYWGKKHTKDPLSLVKKFTMIRDDRKKSFQKGFEPGADIFG